MSPSVAGVPLAVREKGTAGTGVAPRSMTPAMKRVSKVMYTTRLAGKLYTCIQDRSREETAATFTWHQGAGPHATRTKAPGDSQSRVSLDRVAGKGTWRSFVHPSCPWGNHGLCHVWTWPFPKCDFVETKRNFPDNRPPLMPIEVDFRSCRVKWGKCVWSSSFRIGHSQEMATLLRLGVVCNCNFVYCVIPARTLRRTTPWFAEVRLAPLA